MAQNEIICKVNQCRFNNNENCSLESITIGENKNHVKSSEDTLCASFQLEN